MFDGAARESVTLVVLDHMPDRSRLNLLAKGRVWTLSRSTAGLLSRASAALDIAMDFVDERLSVRLVQVSNVALTKPEFASSSARNRKDPVVNLE